MHRLTRPARTPGLHLTLTGNGGVLRDHDGVAAVRLNETAVVLWDLCDGDTTVEEMAVAVGTLAGRDDVLAGISAALDDMETLGAVRLPDVTSSPTDPTESDAH